MKKKEYIIPYITEIIIERPLLLAGSFDEELNGKLDDDYLDIDYGGEGDDLLEID